MTTVKKRPLFIVFGKQSRSNIRRKPDRIKMNAVVDIFSRQNNLNYKPDDCQGVDDSSGRQSSVVRGLFRVQKMRPWFNLNNSMLILAYFRLDN